MTQAPRPPRPRRGRLRWVLFAAFVLVPLLEVYVLIQVGDVIGAGWTIALLIGSGFVGSWLMRREGAQAWRALSDALSSGRMPGRELADAALILIGGTLMLTPGFVTDGVGVLMVLPMTRPAFRLVLAQVITKRLVVMGTAGAGRPGPSRPGPSHSGPSRRGAGGFDAGGPGPDARPPGPPPDGGVVRGEVVDED